jgi:hypothetical protein
LDIIGKAEMEKEIQKTVKKVTESIYILKRDKAEFELDEKELEKYIDSVIREIKKEHKY